VEKRITYITMLRGINVSGQKKIPMTDLKALYEQLGFKDIITYIQSGNVIFKTDPSSSTKELNKRIEKSIEEKFGFKVPVIIRTLDEMHIVIASNPLVKEPDVDTEKLHVTFLEEKPLADHLSTINNPGVFSDRFFVVDSEVYLYCPNGYGNTKLSNTFFENKLKVKATTRNWKTVNKLFELGSG
jgi:uncharacterized protein (DUF1697 family)